MKAYSLDLRERVVRAVERGTSKVATARTFSVSLATVKNYVRQLHDTGSLAPRFSPGRPAEIAPAEHAALVDQLRATPDATLHELCQTWEQTHGAQVSISAMWRTIKRVGWTRKKRLWVPASATKLLAPP